MNIGFIGLGKMGFHMVEHLLKGKHSVTAYNRTYSKTQKIMRKGAKGAKTTEELVQKLRKENKGKNIVIWMMVPHKIVDDMIKQILPHLKRGDILIDGGNSNYKKTVARSKKLKGKGIFYLDVGVSGGLAAAKTGYCMMAGGDSKAFKKVKPAISSMCIKNGYGHFGPSGNGHYVKMVHNGIEYGMMQAMGEGYEVIKTGPYKKTDLLKLSKVWNNGSIISSFLMQMAILGFEHNGVDMKNVDGFVPNTGEGLWTVEEAKRLKVKVPIIEGSLKVRKKSTKQKSFATKVVAVLRDEFGGHGVKKK